MSTTSSTPFPLGVFTGNANTPGSSAEATFDATNDGFDSLMGATPVFQNSYIDFTQAPSAWLSNTSWSASVSAASPTFKNTIPVIALPMGSTSSNAPSSEQILQNYANGTYDSMLQSMVQTWASDGFKTQYWRPGVEMNLNSTPGFVGSSTSMQALWVSAFQHIYTVLHSAAAADGVSLKVIWNPGIANGSAAGNATETMYPGNQYVDVIGADVYDNLYPYSLYDWDKSGQELNSPNPVYDTSLAQWASDPINLEHYYTDPASNQYSLDASGGTSLSLQNLIDFAKAQGKPIAICETGAGSSPTSDNPTFVQWLSSTLTNSGVTVDFVSIWDDNGGGTYAFSDTADDKPLEAAAWAKYFGAQSTTTPTATPITVTPGSENATTNGTASAKPFTGVVITDKNTSQTETAIVTLSSTAHGTLVDPNAATDGSTAASGVWSISGSATTVAAALDALEFSPTSATVAATTTVTAAVTDTAGETASITSTITDSPAGPAHATSAANTQFNGTTGTIYDTSGNAWTINSGQQIEENGTVVPSSAEVVTLFWTGSALDQLNTSGDWWTQPLNGTAGTELAGAPAGYAGSKTPITVSPASASVATTDTASAKPFTGVVVTDANAGQTETAKVTLSATANGTLSDPNAATDGSQVVNGVLTISGSATAVATALDGLVFKPTANQVAPGAVVTTTVTAAITDTAGETASTTSTIKATDVAQAISITPATAAVATTDAASAKPFTGVTIADANAGQTETATVTLSAAANGTLSDPNAATDGSKIANGALTVSGSATSVATTLNGLVFTPTANQVAAGKAVTTTVSASIKDTAGETASAASTITATQPAAAPPTTDTLALQISEDAWKGDAQFTVSVDGKQVGGDYTASTLHSSGDAGTFLLTGNWGTAVNDVQVSFINDAYGGTPDTDRNLYVNSIAYDGTTYAGTSATMLSSGTDTFAVGGATHTAAAPADTVTLSLSEDAWQGNADFVLYIDGKAVTTPQPISALHSANATQAFSFTGNLGAGSHTLGVAFVNDAYGGSSSEDRNLYVNGVTVNGSSIFSGVKALDSNGTSSFSFTTTH
ncbi:carbohydrate-binding domain-containing protein [Acidisoma sp.]|uniref:carbohydrate-binding domain-containing protein n=1 Tax=Acidisoma sp. TaxID=1872115 RepID=UPI003B008261